MLSVFNGFQSVIEDLFSNFDPQIKIVTTSGKVFQPDSIADALNNPEIEHYCYVIEDNALLKFGDKQLPVTIKGVPEDYNKVSGIDSILIEGEFSTKQGSVILNFASEIIVFCTDSPVIVFAAPTIVSVASPVYLPFLKSTC